MTYNKRSLQAKIQSPRQKAWLFYFLEQQRGEGKKRADAKSCGISTFPLWKNLPVPFAFLCSWKAFATFLSDVCEKEAERRTSLRARPKRYFYSYCEWLWSSRSQTCDRIGTRIDGIRQSASQKKRENAGKTASNEGEKDEEPQYFRPFPSFQSIKLFQDSLDPFRRTSTTVTQLEKRSLHLFEYVSIETGVETKFPLLGGVRF